MASTRQGDLRAVVLEVHVLAHARPQLLGLADVDDLAGGVFPQVHAGLGGHRLQLALDARELLLLGLAGATGLARPPSPTASATAASATAPMAAASSTTSMAAASPSPSAQTASATASSTALPAAS